MSKSKKLNFRKTTITEINSKQLYLFRGGFNDNNDNGHDPIDTTKDSKTCNPSVTQHD